CLPRACTTLRLDESRLSSESTYLPCRPRTSVPRKGRSRIREAQWRPSKRVRRQEGTRKPPLLLSRCGPSLVALSRLVPTEAVALLLLHPLHQRQSAPATVIGAGHHDHIEQGHGSDVGRSEGGGFDGGKK